MGKIACLQHKGCFYPLSSHHQSIPHTAVELEKLNLAYSLLR